MMRHFFFAACALVFADAHAIDFSNGCGSGWNQPVVPNSPMGYEFKNACDAHDNCYSRCLRGGVAFGDSVKCDQTPLVKESRRKVCDQDFFGEMARICSKYPTETICRLLGKIYFAAVRLGGSGSFDGYEVQALIERLRRAPGFDTTKLERELDVVIQKNEDLANVRIRVQLSNNAALSTWNTRSQTLQKERFQKEKFGKDVFDLNKGMLQHQIR